MRNAPIAIVLMWLAMALGLAPPAPAAARCEVAAFVQSAGEAYDRAARIGTPEAFASAAARYSDLRAISFFALGRYRKDLPKAREAEYLALTRKFIGSFMVEHGAGFRASDLEIIDCKPSGPFIVANVRLSTGGKVIFRIARTATGYQIADISMEGIWLVQQMRSTFVGTISRTGTIDGLFAYLKS
jgi:ABC-type transporter MlaC component